MNKWAFLIAMLLVGCSTPASKPLTTPQNEQPIVVFSPEKQVIDEGILTLAPDQSMPVTKKQAMKNATVKTRPLEVLKQELKEEKPETISVTPKSPDDPDADFIKASHFLLVFIVAVALWIYFHITRVKE